MKTKQQLVIFLVLFLGACSSASPIVFHFINPSFGGYPSNAGWLMQSAASTQKKYLAEPEPWTTSSTDALAEFERSLNR
ncbi:curli assembly protein CsgF, partial [Patescibacteria group bacterium]|nr:curli assembly protein CsgF [Patescibacteria group bacterium]